MPTPAPTGKTRRPPSRLVAVQRKYRRAYDAAALLLYLLVVYSGSFYLPAMGPDFALAADPSNMSSPIAAWVYTQELRFLGPATLPYHAVNLALLYACTLLVYNLARRIYPEGPIWLATLAAALFMANPVHAAGVLPLSSVDHLLPALAALLTLTLHAHARATEQPLLRVIPWALLAAAVGCFPTLIALPLVIVLYEAIIRPNPSQRPILPVTAAIVLFGAGLAFHGPLIAPARLDLQGMFAPLYFIAYPIGFLPENARRFHEWPILGWIAAATVLCILYLVGRKANHRAFVFCLAAAAVPRLFQGHVHVDPVHLTNTGPLLVSTALASIALAVVFGRIMLHPKWVPIVVTGTTLLALTLFGIQMYKIGAWRHAARQIASFQDEARTLSAAHPGVPIGVLPDFQHYRGAPLSFSDSIAHDTPFGTAVPHRTLLPLDYDPSLAADDESEPAIVIAGHGEHTAIIHIRHADPLRLLPWPYTLAREDAMELDEIHIEVLERGENLLTIRIDSPHAPLPPLLAGL